MEAAQGQASQYSSMTVGRIHEAPPLEEKLLVIAGCGERESQFSIG